MKTRTEEGSPNSRGEGDETQESPKSGSDTGVSDIEDHPVILFDGVCNLCTGFVQFVIPRDPEGKFRFAPLQSEIGEQLASKHGIPTEELETFALIEDGKSYTKSSAAIKVLRGLGGIYSVAVVSKIVPGRVRDFFYDFVADRRYAWFGQRDQCMVPSPDIENRFLDKSEE